MRTGIFVGSFDPFTTGHDSIVRRALPLLDRLVIGIGVNPGKGCMLPAEDRLRAIAGLYVDETRIETRLYGCLTADFAREVGAGFIVKGARNAADFEYERAQAIANRELSGLETVLLIAEPRLEHVSSSLVREILRFGGDAGRYVPPAVMAVMAESLSRRPLGQRETDRT